MNSGRSDASTSTDDVKSRPLCLFYFTHPFGVLSPEPPTLAPAHVARAFLNMQRASPPSAGEAWCAGDLSPSSSYNSASSSSHPPHLSVARAPPCTLRLRRDSLSSSLFSGDMWFNSSSSCRSSDYPRRLIPYNRILPPLRLPSPRDSSNADSSEELWPRKCLNPERFSLPPIELPAAKVSVVRSKKCVVSSEEACSSGASMTREVRARRRLGVSKPRRAARAADLRRLLAALMRRAPPGGVRGGGGGASPALRDALNTIREAWAEPTSLRARCAAVRVHYRAEAGARARAGAEAEAFDNKMEAAPLVRAGASPGLMRRRYSVPETIMRKYRLAQQRSDTEESPPATSRSAASPSPGACDTAARRHRDVLRRAGGPCCCCAPPRSLGASRSDLRPLSGGPAWRPSPAAPWASPKRQRLDARDLRASDEMLRAAMRNSYERAPRRAARDACTQYSDRHSSTSPTADLKSLSGEEDAPSPPHHALSDERSLSDTDSFSASLCTAKENLRPRPTDLLPRAAHFSDRISEHSAVEECNDNGLLPYDQPLTIDTTPSYEMLEIVVSETMNGSPVPGVRAPATAKLPPNTLRTPPPNQRTAQNINIDEYVSNILVESLNSLTDQLECMNASICSDRKISIVEKEIKVKLQNTGVNTIVHLSPTSNNQIIFGNEELCHEETRHDTCNNNNALNIREEALSVESNNNVTSAEPPAAAPRCSCDSFDIQHDNVNQAVLQQIQKLFHDELHNLAPNDYPSAANMPEISHVEMSDVDAFIDNAEAELRAQDAESSAADLSRCQYEVIGGIGAGNYFPHGGDNPVVPRFSALPHTDSMEVNTSSSDDADLIGSDCTSLVDSLDDPNSPRSVLLRRACARRGDLVRSAIDVLDLLPENARDDRTPRDKPESFFIGIKDDECDCDKENVNVADRMPEKIRQRLYRRHRKRELRMESARRMRTRQQRRDARDLQRDCAALLNALIDDVIAKIAQDEYKCMRIKHRPARTLAARPDENRPKRTWRKEEPLDDREPFRAIKNDSVRLETKERSQRHRVHGKLSLRPPTTDDRAAKRIYQKSEIHDGDKCIEILEILEYVNGSQSSSETTNSDENQNHCTRSKKSRIPVPVNERGPKSPGGESQRSGNRRGSGGSSGGPERSGDTNRLIADMLLEALGEPPSRRASLAAPAPRFRQLFDMIPEERSSLSLDEPDEGAPRRASAPDIVDTHCELSERDCDDAPPAPAPLSPPALLGLKDTKSAATSPLSDMDANKRALHSKHQTTMTSPSSKSAATSPPRATGGRAGPPLQGAADEKTTGLDAVPMRRSVTTQHDSQRGVPPAPTERSERTKRNERNELSKRNERNELSKRNERNELSKRNERGARPTRAAPPRRASLARSLSYEGVSSHAPDVRSSDEPRDDTHKPIDKRKHRSVSVERGEEETIRAVKLPEFKGGGGEAGGVGGAGGTSSDSSESGASLLCARWLTPARARRPPRPRVSPATPAPPAAPPRDHADAPGGWSVTVAGSCRAALPADVEMRLRFPHEGHVPHPPATQPCQECTCRHCAACECGARSPPRPRLPAARPPRTDSKLTLTMKKEALDSSILASKSTRKSSELPDLETYRASRSKLKSSVKTRRGYSLHCWLPDNDDAPIRARNGLSVLGCAIVPELKPRVRTMSERDLTRVYTPRQYLRS